MWNNNRKNNKNGEDDKEKTVAKTAGFVVFSGIAMSILKALNPCNKNTISTTTINNNNDNEATKAAAAAAELTESTQPPPPPQEPITKKPCHSEVKPAVVEPSPSETSLRSIEIVKGDTLWGLSRKYGVSIEAIKDANGFTGDTIYAGKKLIIP